MCAAGLQKRDWEFKKLNASEQLDLGNLGCRPEMKPPSDFRDLLKQYGYSDRVIKEIWKWYDSSEKKGVASF
jgi:hypothetical protein